MMGISLLICLGTAFATIGVVILETVYRHWIESYTLQDSLQTLERIRTAVSELPDLPPKERTGKRRAIAKDILRDVGFLVYLLDDCRNDSDPEIRERACNILREIMRLNWELRQLLFLLRFRPKLIADCQRIFDAAGGHCRVWIAYLHLLNAKYPELYRRLRCENLG